MRATCQRLDELQSIRLPQDARPTQPHGDLELRAVICVIIREELQLHDPPTYARDHFRTDGPQLRDLVKEDLASMKGLLANSSPLHTPPALSYAGIVSKPPLTQRAPLAHEHLSVISTRTAPRSYYTNMRPSRQYFPNDRPVCYYCGIRGHIAGVCRRRQQDDEVMHRSNAK